MIQSLDDTLPSTGVRVLIADDHPVVRAGLRAELTRHADMHVVGEATNGDSALRMLQKFAVEVLLLDVSMPGIPATALLQQIAALPAPPRVLIVSAHSDVEHILAMLKAGATGYLLKDEDPTTITTAIRTVACGRTWMSAAVMSTVVAHSVKEAVKPVESSLSSREIEVLGHLSEGKDNQEIGKALYISERTVRFHLRNIYDKLQLRRGEAIAWSVRNGFARADLAVHSGAE